MFDIVARNGFSKIALLTTKHGEIETPTIFPVHNLGADAGWNTPKYWDSMTQIRTGMFNAAYLHMDKRNRLKNILKKGIHDYIGFPGICFIDSGGFIYEKYNLNISQLEMLTLQEKAGADIASTLDMPIRLKNPKNTRVSQSVENAKKAFKYRTKKDMLLFASIHGYDPTIIRNVIRHLRKYAEFDGFALGSLMRSYSNYRLLVDLVLTARREIPNKPLHIYGLSGVQVIPLLVFLGADTTDSSSFIIAAAKREFIVPGFGRVPIAQIDGMGFPPCKCPICSKHSVPEIRMNRDYLAIHNVWAIWFEIEKLKTAIREGMLEEYLQSRFARNPWAKRAFRYAKRRTRYGFIGE